MSLIRVEVFDSIRCVRVNFLIPGGGILGFPGALPDAILGLPGALLVFILPKWAKSLARVLQEGSGRALGGLLGPLGAKKKLSQESPDRLGGPSRPGFKEKEPRRAPQESPQTAS